MLTFNFIPCNHFISLFHRIPPAPWCCTLGFYQYCPPPSLSPQPYIASSSFSPSYSMGFKSLHVDTRLPITSSSPTLFIHFLQLFSSRPSALHSAPHAYNISPHSSSLPFLASSSFSHSLPPGTFPLFGFHLCVIFNSFRPTYSPPSFKPLFSFSFSLTSCPFYLTLLVLWIPRDAGQVSVSFLEAYDGWQSAELRIGAPWWPTSIWLGAHAKTDPRSGFGSALCVLFTY